MTPVPKFKVNLTKTALVKLKGTDVECLIDEGDFDKELHVRLKKKLGKKSDKKPKPLDGPPVEVMETMTLEVIRALPEWAQIDAEAAEKVTTKGDAIALILAGREDS